MTAIIDAQDLARYMARSIEANSDQEAAVNEIIDGLEADLEAFLGRPITLVEVTDEEIPVIHPPGKVFLRQTPVRDVTALTYDGSAVTSYAVESWGLSGVGMVLFPGPVTLATADPPRPLISYTAGLPGDDPTSAFARAARALLLRAAARDFNQVIRQDLAGVARGSVEGTSLEFHGGVRAGAGGLTDDERKSMVRWKRRRVR